MSLLEEYRKDAILHTECTENGRYRKGNNAHDRLQETFLKIVKSGCGNDLFSFYDDENTGVQAWAASHTLELDESRALEKLRQLESADIPHISFDAKYVIEGWESEDLRFLPEGFELDEKSDEV